MYVRWMGSFRKNGSLSESLMFETTRSTNVACEHFNKKPKVGARVGLLVDPKAIYKRYPSDVWSEYETDGTLIRTGRYWKGKTNHTECFAKPVYTGLVIKGGFENLSNMAKKEIKIAQKNGFNLPIYKLINGKLSLDTL